jgi:5-methylthioadenosine/S-adenosylhomocysteine deaminase
LGTDGSASNNDVDMFAEMRSAALIHKLQQMDPTVMDAATCVDLATRGGARALGREDELGCLRPGALADIIVLDFSAPHLTPVYDPLSHLVYAARGADVLHSVIGGQVVMRARTLTTVDQGRIIEDMQRLCHEIRAIGL